ncbi:MAG TPA: hypoxanthine phosphoribosyltransferase [Chitinophagales bacterium]|nr:hypoxanthine phosphoribosyltransferase [Chitinophagales bacterium]
MEKLVRLNDRTFRLYKSENEILTAVRSIAHQINDDYIGKRPLLIPVLNGSFLFAADLLKELKLDCEISFVKTASYHGTQSNGNPVSLIGLNQSIEGRHVIVLEDIVDTGNTLSMILPTLEKLNPASLKVASLLFKPMALQTDVQIDYIGMEIPNEFIVGYGLDYDGLGRNLRDIYQVVEGE